MCRMKRQISYTNQFDTHRAYTNRTIWNRVLLQMTPDTAITILAVFRVAAVVRIRRGTRHVHQPCVAPALEGCDLLPYAT